MDDYGKTLQEIGSITQKGLQHLRDLSLDGAQMLQKSIQNDNANRVMDSIFTQLRNSWNDSAERLQALTQHHEAWGTTDGILTYLFSTFHGITQATLQLFPESSRTNQMVERAISAIIKKEHRRSAAAALFVTSIMLGFPTGDITSVVLFIPRGILVGVLGLFGFKREGVERGSIAAGYQSRTYGGHTAASSRFSGFQSGGAVGMRGLRGGTLSKTLLSWGTMIISVTLFAHS